jgi:hypothetical protein
MSPRGLISILLFIQLKEVQFIDLTTSPIDERVLLIVILISMLVMLIGTLKRSEQAHLKDNLIDEEEIPITVEMKIDSPESSENETEDPLN